MHHFTADRAGRIADLEADQAATRSALWTCQDVEEARRLRRQYDENRELLADLHAELGPVYDADLTEATATISTRGGRLVGVDVHKVGGGTVGRRYTGLWAYRAADLLSGEILAEGDDLYTGTPSDHADAVDLLRLFLDEAEGFAFGADQGADA